MNIFYFGYLFIGSGISLFMYWKNKSECSAFAVNLKNVLYGPKTDSEIAKEKLAILITVILIACFWPFVLAWASYSRVYSYIADNKNKRKNDFISVDYLINEVNPIEEEQNHLIVTNIIDPPIPFGYMHQGWIDLLAIMEHKDTMWSFAIPCNSRVGEFGSKIRANTKGYSILRSGRVIAEFAYEGG